MVLGVLLKGVLAWSHGLSAQRARRTKSSRPEGQKAGPKGRQLHDQQLWYMINRLSWQWLMFIVHDRQSFIPMINSCDEWSTVFHGNDQYLSYMINSLCICVFSCQTLRNIIFEVLASFPFQKYNTCLVKLQILPKLYLCICVFVFVYLHVKHLETLS